MTKKGGTLFIQPHSDDMVMSSYFIIKSGVLPKPYYIVTVFSKSNWTVPVNRKRLKLPQTVRGVTRIRSNEDKTFAKKIGARCVFLGFADCLLRTGKIFSKPDVTLDVKLVNDVSHAISNIIQESHIQVMVAHYPCGPKQHFDHRIVQRALMSMNTPTKLYFVDDIPYSRVNVMHNLKISEIIKIDGIRKKFKSMNIYKSQMCPSFFERVKKISDRNGWFERLLEFSPSEKGNNKIADLQS